MTSLTDRFRFLAGQREKTPILAAVPEVKPDGTTAVLRLYDPIDSWGEVFGVSAKEFVAALDALPPDTNEIRLHVNSPGGEVFEAIAILNALRAHSARVVVVVEGIAASMASVIAVGADELVMARNSELMIHDAWGLCVGNAGDMTKMADDLARMSDNLASIYAAKTGSVEEWRAVMAAETWYSAQEAVDAGLADRIGAEPADAKAKARFDLSVFRYAGRSAAPQTPAAALASGPPATAQEVHMFTDEQVAELRTRLGMPDADADGDAILAALDEALTERAEATPEVPEGQVLVPAAALADLQAAAETTRALAERQHTRDRAELLDSFRDRFAPASRAAWERQYDIDPEGTRNYLASAPVIVPLTEAGHAGESATNDDALYASLFGQEA